MDHETKEKIGVSAAAKATLAENMENESLGGLL